MIFIKKFCRFKKIVTFAILNPAKVAQLVERDLAKVEVAGSRPVFRSKSSLSSQRGCFFSPDSNRIGMPRWWNW